jgi:signal transduction histidine kinase
MTILQPGTATRPELARARGLLTVGDSYLDWMRRHRLPADAALAAVVMALSVSPASAIPGRHKGESLALILAVVCPLVWRRRAPFLVFVIITVLALVQFVTNHEVTDDIALLVAFYTVAAQQSPRRILAAVVMLEAGAVLLSLVTSPVPWVWPLLSSLFVAPGALGFYARTRRAYLASLEDRAERLERELDQQAQLAAAAERARIAREMHDIVAHNIAVMIALADGAACTAASNTGQAVTLMGEVSATGRSALTEMRRLLGVLRQPATPGHAPQPTLADLDDLLAAVRAAGLPTRLTVTGQPFPLPPSAQLALYRLIQEALTNALKHAPGTTAQVCLTYLPGEVELDVTDDGPPGTGPATGQRTSSPHGHGIAGMRERAAVFGGTVAAGPRPGGGWRVRTVLRLGLAPADSEPATGTELR